MNDLNTSVKKKTRSADRPATLMGLETKRDETIPENYFGFSNCMSNRFGIIFLDDKDVVTSGMQEWVLGALQVGHPAETKTMAASSILLWPAIGHGILDNSKNCTACWNEGKKVLNPIT